jgi:hypothetical protein
LWIALGEKKNLIVRAGNCLAQPARDSASFLVQPVPNDLHSLFCGDFAGSFTPHSVDNDKNAPFGVTDNSVLVILPLFPGICFSPGFPGYGVSRFLHSRYLERISLK